MLLAYGAIDEARTYQAYLEEAGLKTSALASGSDVLEAVDRCRPSLLLFDLHLPDISGLNVLRHLSKQQDRPSAVVTTSNASISGAIEAVRAGAYDYLVKPFSAQRLVTAVRAALLSVDESAAPRARHSLHGSRITGSSRPMRAVYRIIETAASSKATVFITGESGTGKEVVAQLVHAKGGRAGKPFVAINCGALPKDLVETEVFGHVKGAFTGALNDRPGAVLQAHGGTLFLDEICEMPIELQAKLLRFLQEGTVRRVGASVAEKVDVRVVCATNRDPVNEIRAGRFREDLFYRLHVIPVHLPPLRERENDAVEIARAFILEYAREEGKRFKRLGPSAERVIAGYRWPGNVRQLQNVIRNAVVLNDGEELTAAELPELADLPRSGTPPAREPLDDGLEPTKEASQLPEMNGYENGGLIRTLGEVEREAIERAIAICNNNIARAAAALGVSPSTIYRKRQAWQTGRPTSGGSGA